VEQTNVMHEDLGTNEDDSQHFITFSIECFPKSLDVRPDTVTLHYQGDFPQWLLYPKTDFIILFDGERKAFDDVKVSGDVISADDCLEQFTVDFTYDEFRKIAFAQDVEAPQAF
jgi:hypothetical protein